MQRVINDFAANFTNFVEATTERIVKIDFYAAHSHEQVRQFATAAIGAFQADLKAGTLNNFAAYWERVGRSRAQAGAVLDDMLTAVVIAEAVFNEFFSVHYASDATARAWWLEHQHKIIYNGVLELARVFSNVREQMIRDQAAQLQELSTPLIPLYRGILALPLVGTIDSHRAGQIMEALLQGIAREHAAVVLMDITGVPMVDTQVANYLIQAARTARLLGAQTVLVGIGPEIAQTIVQLGIDLSDIATRANLEAGIQYALSLRGLEIAPIAGSAVAETARDPRWN